MWLENQVEAKVSPVVARAAFGALARTPPLWKVSTRVPEAHERKSSAKKMSVGQPVERELAPLRIWESPPPPPVSTCCSFSLEESRSREGSSTSLSWNVWYGCQGRGEGTSVCVCARKCVRLEVSAGRGTGKGGEAKGLCF